TPGRTVEVDRQDDESDGKGGRARLIRAVRGGDSGGHRSRAPGGRGGPCAVGAASHRNGLAQSLKIPPRPSRGSNPTRHKGHKGKTQGKAKCQQGYDPPMFPSTRFFPRFALCDLRAFVVNPPRRRGSRRERSNGLAESAGIAART